MGFAFTDYAQVWPAIDGDLGDFVRAQIVAKTGLVPMERIWDLGFRQITTSTKPIKSAADLAGLKTAHARCAPSLVSLFKALDAIPVSMQFGEVYSALQTHIVDGQENPLSQIDAGKFYEVQKYCSITNHVWDGHWISCNAAAWDRLPPDMQEIVARNFNEVALRQRDDIAKLDQSLQSALQAEGAGVQRRRDRKLPRPPAQRRLLQGMAREARRGGLDAAREAGRQAGVVSPRSPSRNAVTGCFLQRRLRMSASVRAISFDRIIRPSSPPKPGFESMMSAWQASATCAEMRAD